MAKKGQILGSWKDIASYLGRTVRTCQRLEASMGLPVHRLDGSPKAHVFAYSQELDAWLAEKVHERDQNPKPRRLLRLLPALVVVLLVIGIALMVVLRGKVPGRGEGSSPVAEGIAILPFTDLSPAKSLAGLANGMADDVRMSLMQVPDLRVPGHDSSAAVKQLTLDPREIGSILKVQYVLTGTLRETGEMLRLSVALISTKTGSSLWAQEYDLAGVEQQDAGGRIAATILAKLELPALRDQERDPRKRSHKDPLAYEFYLRGRYLLGQLDPNALSEALDYFKEAVRRDPEFAPAFVGIAWARMNRIVQRAVRPREEGPHAEEAVKRALMLDPDLAEAHAINAWVQFLYDFDWEAAERSFRNALRLQPGDSMTRGMYAFFLVTRGRGEEAQMEIQRALASDPYTPVLSAYNVWIQVYTGHYREVLDEVKKFERSGRPFEFAYMGAGEAYFIQGRFDQSIQMFEKAKALPHSIKRSEAALARAYLGRGDREKAVAIYEQLCQQQKTDLGVSATDLAWIAAQLGDFRAALNWLRAAINEHDHHVASMHLQTGIPPAFACDPRFLAILDELRLPHTLATSDLH
jgi:TolB-like protein/Tfp pilus assembly protein PilF